MPGLRSIRTKTRANALQPLALSFVLPHEHRPMRLPVVPATLTALMSGMCETTIPITDGASKRAFLCRDPCYPFWIEKTCDSVSFALAASIQNIPLGQANRSLPTPDFDQYKGWSTAGKVDNVAIVGDDVAQQLVVIGRGDGNPAIYIPSGGLFTIFLTGSTAATSNLEAEVSYFVAGEERTSTLRIDNSGGNFVYMGQPGTTTSTSGLLLEGRVPIGFTFLRSLRIGLTALTGDFTNATIYLGWTTGGTLIAPTSSVPALVPFAQPPEFVNSRLPYQRTRLNASSALLTNVSAALTKEGTILAARLKANSVDPWIFKATNIDSVNPQLRYYGPLEKGLYTFTTPSGNMNDFADCVYYFQGQVVGSTDRPVFNYMDIGIYNAIILSDLGSAAEATQLAVSQYMHLEFETTSSLFSLGVSTLTLESLHATEVALLKFGHFHENPVHWAALKAATSAALRYVAPMVAPIVQHYGQKLLDKGVAYLSTKPTGDRTMTQATLTTPSKPRRPRAKPKATRKKSKR